MMGLGHNVAGFKNAYIGTKPSTEQLFPKTSKIVTSCPVLQYI